MRVAVEGCCHGELDRIYDTILQLEKQNGQRIDLLICCGDFQAVRNLDDLECLACPPKYRDIRTFYKYYTGEKKAPIPTLFIGGNHEACNHLWELYYGGWVAPNIYYLGHAGVVNFGGLRIGGISGTYSEKHYKLGHFERPPYTEGSMRSAYHVRELQVFRMLQLQKTPDIMLSHDWPQHIAKHGDINDLFKCKPFLRTDINTGALGSPPAMQLLQELQPKHWFSAHHHVKYSALVEHLAPRSIQGKASLQAAEEQPAGSSSQNGTKRKTEDLDVMFTKFLALDKCLPRRRFLQVLDFPDAQGPKEFHYDAEWLAILRSTHHLLSLEYHAKPLPGMGGSLEGPSEEQISWIGQRFATRSGSLKIPENFQPTVPAYDPSSRSQRGRMPQQQVKSPQTVEFLELLDLPYNLGDTSPAPEQISNPEEIDLTDEELVANPEEIAIDDDADANSEDESPPEY